MKKLFIILVLIISVLYSNGQTPQMRTRLLTSLTNVEVEKYLERNDVIFIPVGTVEVHGGFPIDCEYVGPLALAMKMAEKADGLVLPYLTYFYPGATQVGRATVQVSPTEGTEYLKVIARSLLRQGFKTQIYITNHGPAYSYMEPLVFEILDEEKVPILYINKGTLLSLYGGQTTRPVPDPFFFGAYSIVGRLNDIPLNFDGIDLPKDFVAQGAPKAAAKLLRLNNVQATQWYYNEQFDHGGVPTSMTDAERDKLAKDGVDLINKIIDAMDVNGVIKSLKEHQKYIEETAKKYGKLLDF